MRRVSDGYTILEVMIFLAVSSALLIAGMKLVSGKQNQVDFNQAVRATQSQLQTWISSSSSGFTGADPASQSCKIQGIRPEILNTQPGSGYTPQCVFLGEAVQFPPTKGDTIYAYSVFGCRLAGCTSSGSLPTNLQESNPMPAVGNGGGQDINSVDLTQSFSVTPLYVKSVTSKPTYGAGTSSQLVGFYGSINSGDPNAANGQSDVNSYIYNFNGAVAADQPSGSVARNCLEMSSSCGFSPPSSYPYPTSLDSLTICLTDGSHYAQVIITSSSGIGADVTYNYTNC